MSEDPTRRPGGLTGIAIVAVILGGLGVCGGVVGIGGIALQEPLRALRSQMHVQNDTNVAALQDTMQRETDALNQKYMPINAGLSVLNVFGSSALLLGGVLLLSLKPPGRALAMVGCGALAVIDTAMLVVGSLLQYEMSGVMTRTMSQIASTSGGAVSPQVKEMTRLAMGGGILLAMAIGGLWMLVKLGFYVTTCVYLRRPHVRELFR